MKSTIIFYKYNDIPLKLYFEIIASGNFLLLIKSGNASQRECLEAWELIVEENSIHNNNYDYMNCLALQKSVAFYYNEYQLVKSAIVLVAYKQDLNIINYLNEIGYPVDNSTPEKLLESLTITQAMSDNLITKIKMKQNELDLYYKPVKTKKNSAYTFDHVMANLLGQGFQVDDSLTLIRYNACIQVINDRKPKQKEKWQA